MLRCTRQKQQAVIVSVWLSLTLNQRKPPFPPAKSFTECADSRGFNLWTRRRLCQQTSHGCARPRRPPFPPRFKPLAGVLDVLKQVWILECCAPRRNDRAHAIPHHPNLAVALKEQFVVDQSAIHNTRHHVPITDDHSNVSVFLAPLREFLHHFFGRQRVKMFHAPRPRLPEPRFTPHIVKSKHQIDFVIAQLRHRESSLSTSQGYTCVFSSGSRKTTVCSRSWDLDIGMLCRWNSI